MLFLGPLDDGNTHKISDLQQLLVLLRWRFKSLSVSQLKALALKHTRASLPSPKVMKLQT